MEYDEQGKDKGYVPAVACAALLLVIVAVTLYEVVARYLFASPTIWANELSLLLSGIVFLVSGVYVMWRDEHLRISVIRDAVPCRLQRFFDLVALICTLVFCGGLAWFGFPTAWQALVTWERFGTAWNPPIPAILKPLIVVAAAVMAVLAVVNFIHNNRRPSGRTHEHID